MVGLHRQRREAIKAYTGVEVPNGKDRCFRNSKTRCFPYVNRKTEIKNVREKKLCEISKGVG